MLTVTYYLTTLVVIVYYSFIIVNIYIYMYIWIIILIVVLIELLWMCINSILFTLLVYVHIDNCLGALLHAHISESVYFNLLLLLY